MDLAVSRRHVTAEFLLDPNSVYVSFVVNKLGAYQVFLRVLRFPCQYRSTSTPYTSSSTCCFYQKDKEAKLGNLTKELSFGNRGALDRKVLSLSPFAGLSTDFR